MVGFASVGLDRAAGLLGAAAVLALLGLRLGWPRPAPPDRNGGPGSVDPEV